MGVLGQLGPCPVCGHRAILPTGQVRRHPPLHGDPDAICPASRTWVNHEPQVQGKDEDHSVNVRSEPQESAMPPNQPAAPREWDYQITDLIRTVDGDTADLTIAKRMDFGFYLREDKEWSSRFRLLGGDAFETNEAGGAAATRFTNDFITRGISDGLLRGQTFKADSFGRWLIDIYRADNSVRLIDQLRVEGLLDPTSKWNKP